MRKILLVHLSENSMFVLNLTAQDSGPELYHQDFLSSISGLRLPFILINLMWGYNGNGDASPHTHPGLRFKWKSSNKSLRI